MLHFAPPSHWEVAFDRFLLTDWQRPGPNSTRRDGHDAQSTESGLIDSLDESDRLRACQDLLEPMKRAGCIGESQRDSIIQHCESASYPGDRFLDARPEGARLLPGT
jgi:hypothetical protein